jgi:phospholipase/carboxylesterase/glyoxalase family protein
MNIDEFIHRFEPGVVVAKSPTLLTLHGTGGDENDLVGLAQTMLPGANILSPRGTVLENGMPRFFRRLAEGVFDLEDLKFRTNELADFVQAAAGHYGFDAARLYAMGYSNGANIAASMLLLRPKTLVGAALFRAMVPLIPDEFPDLSGVPVLICSGVHDPIVSTAQRATLVELLERSNANVELFAHDAGHGLTQRDVEVARDWLARVTR